MKIIRMGVVLALSMGMLLAAGCAKNVGLYGVRTANTITYKGTETKHTVAFTVKGDYVYEKKVDNYFMGIELIGHLFRAPDGSTVLVAKMPRDDFEDLIGYPLKSPTWGIKAHPPRTEWLELLCQLARAYVVTLDEEVMTAIKLQTFKDEAGECTRDWESEEEIMAEDPALMTRFEETADRSIVVDWK